MNRLFICSANEKQYSALVKQAQLPSLALTNQIGQANIILADPPLIAPMVKQAHKLQWLQATFAGCDRLVSEHKQDYQLTNIRGIFGPLMSEYVFGFLLSSQRHLFEYRLAQANKCWSPLPYQGLTNQKITILGTGSIGQHLAATAKHFGMQVTGVNQQGHAVAGFDRIFASHQLAQAINNADVIVCALPATAQTNAILNKQLLAHCQNATLFNVGRGNVVVDADLLWAIDNQHIAQAVLDVFATEPLPADHPFWRHESICITPHIAAVTFAKDAFTIFSQNYQRWLAGQPLQHLVDFSKGY